MGKSVNFISIGIFFDKRKCVVLDTAWKHTRQKKTHLHFYRGAICMLYTRWKLSTWSLSVSVLIPCTSRLMRSHSALRSPTPFFNCITRPCIPTISVRNWSTTVFPKGFPPTNYEQSLFTHVLYEACDTYIYPYLPCLYYLKHQ